MVYPLQWTAISQESPQSSFEPITVQQAAVLRVTVSGTHCHLFVIVTDNKAHDNHHAPQLLSSLQLGVPGNRLF